MAYVSKQDKSKIVAAVKAVMPKSWKATFGVSNSSTIVMTIKSTPFSLENIFGQKHCDEKSEYYRDDNGALSYYSVNHYNFEKNVENKEVLNILKKIVDALNTDNYNNSDPYTDYFDVGHYIKLQFGKHDSPYVVKS